MGKGVVSMRYKLFIAVIAIFWLGMIFAIGMESIVKFNTPSLIKAVGFDVGRTVFSAFNKAQLVLLVGMIVCAVPARLKLLDQSFIALITLFLLLQIFWLFPALSERVDMILSGVKPQPTYKHAYYGLLEIGKLIMLVLLASRLIN
jgi:hypothetical protein